MKQGGRIAWFALAALLGIGLWLWSQPAREPAQAERPVSRAPAPSPASETAAAPAQPAPTPRQPGDLTVASGEVLPIALADLPPGEPVVVTLLLGVPSAGSVPRPTRVVGTDGRTLELGAELSSEDRSRASLAIDPEWLTPGRYLVEVKTTEATHFPLRRYVLEVR